MKAICVKNNTVSHYIDLGETYDVEWAELPKPPKGNFRGSAGYYWVFKDGQRIGKLGTICFDLIEDIRNRKLEELGI